MCQCVCIRVTRQQDEGKSRKRERAEKSGDLLRGGGGVPHTSGKNTELSGKKNEHFCKALVAHLSFIYF